MKKLLHPLSFLLMSIGTFSLSAQSWFQKVYPHATLNEKPYSISMATQAGSYVPFIAGSSGTTQSKNQQDLMVMQIDFNGNLMYSEAFGTTGRREIGQASILNNDTLIIGGIDGPSGSNRGIQWRFNTSSYSMIDHTRYTSASGPGMFRAVTNNGINNVFSGPYQANSGGVFRGFSLLESDRSNPLSIVNSVSTKDVASSGRLLSARDIAFHPANKTYHQVGYQQSAQAWYAAYDTLMVAQALALYSYTECSRLTFVGIEQLNNNEFLILTRGISCSGTYGQDDIIILKVDLAGTIIDQRVYGDAGDEDPRAIKVASNGQIIVTGSTNSFSANGDHDIFMMSLNQDLTLDYFKTFETNSFDDLMTGSNTAMGFGIGNTGHEHAFIVAYVDDDDQGLWITEIIKSPVVSFADETCVVYHAIENEVSEVTKQDKTPGRASWGSATAITQNLINLDLEEVELCDIIEAKTTLSDATSQTEGYSLNFYPNPVENALNLDFGTQTSGTISVQVFDISGKLLLEESIEKGASNHQINTSGLNSGSYILQLKHQNGKTESHQFMKP